MKGSSLSQNIQNISGVRLQAGDNLLSSVNQPLVGGLVTGSTPKSSVTDDFANNTNDSRGSLSLKKPLRQLALIPNYIGR